MPEAAFSMSVMPVENKYLYVIGGQNNLIIELIQRYSITTNSWEIFPLQNRLGEIST